MIRDAGVTGDAGVTAPGGCMYVRWETVSKDSAKIFSGILQPP